MATKLRCPSVIDVRQWLLTVFAINLTFGEILITNFKRFGQQWKYMMWACPQIGIQACRETVILEIQPVVDTQLQTRNAMFRRLHLIWTLCTSGCCKCMDVAFASIHSNHFSDSVLTWSRSLCSWESRCRLATRSFTYPECGLSYSSSRTSLYPHVLSIDASCNHCR